MKQLILVIALWISVVSPAHGAWVNLSGGLDEADLRFVTADTRSPKVIYAASERILYQSDDEGQSWKRVLSIRGESNKINFVLINPFDPKEVYVATDKGVRVSHESGRKWEIFFEGAGNSSEESLSVAVSFRNPEQIFIGTSGGLLVVDKRTRVFKEVPGMSGGAVYSIFQIEGEGYEILVAAEKGIYRNKGDLNSWERVYSNVEIKEEKQDTSLEQFDIEEVFTKPYFSNLAFLNATQCVYAGTQAGILEAGGRRDSWTSKANQNLPDKKVNAVACSVDFLYTATDQGIFRSEEGKRAFESLNEGLESKEVRHIFYNPGGNYLLAATQKGIFKYRYPELKIESVFSKPQKESMDAQALLNIFQGEPTIREIQEAAVRYAEVHPGKIQAWRQAAAVKAWLPTVSLDAGVSADENVDLDRGGTNDPDKFILGPREKSYDWSVGVNWDLGDLVWNDDQTSIDTRSKLMVELRDDILNEVTHLYFERKRLQVERMLGSSKELPIQIDKEIRLEELTAGIDALTGGYFSKHLGENLPSRSQ